MATLYYNAAVDTAWDTLGNWWNDPDFTDPATSIPVDGDEVYLAAQLDTPPSNSVTLSHTRVAHGSTGGGTFGVNLYYSRPAGSITFYGHSSNEGQNISDDGTVSYREYSRNNGASYGGAYFYDSSSNHGTLEGGDGFYDSSANYSSGSSVGEVYFHDSSANYGDPNYAVFYDSSTNHGNPSRAYFYDSSANYGSPSEEHYYDQSVDHNLPDCLGYRGGDATTDCAQTCYSPSNEDGNTYTDPNQNPCSSSSVDALGYCCGDATTDCAGNYYSPSNEDGNLQQSTNVSQCSNSTSTDVWGVCCGDATNSCSGSYYYSPSNKDNGAFGTTTDPSGTMCNSADLDALGYCCGDATLDCSTVNYYSPSNEDGNTVYDPCEGSCLQSEIGGSGTCCDQTWVDFLGYCGGTCNDSSACGEDLNGCLYPDCAGTCGGSLYYGCTDPAYCNYDSGASCDDGSCGNTGYYGCTDPAYCNYDGGASCDDGSCGSNGYGYYGCTDDHACNYDPNATCDDGSCYGILGCTDAHWCNFNPNATCESNAHYSSTCDCDGRCWGYNGCTDPAACNYDSGASCDDGSCVYFYDFAQDSCVSIAFPSPAQVASGIAFGINHSQTGTLTQPNTPQAWGNYTYYAQGDVVSLGGFLWELISMGGWTVGGRPDLGYGWQKLSTGGTSRPAVNIAGLIGLPPFIQL